MAWKESRNEGISNETRNSLRYKKKTTEILYKWEDWQMLAIPISEYFCYYLLSLYCHCICCEDSTNNSSEVYKSSLCPWLMQGIFDLRQRQLRHTFLAHDAPVKSIVVDDNEEFFISGSEDGDIKVRTIMVTRCKLRSQSDWQYLVHHWRKSYRRQSYNSLEVN